MEKHTSLCRLNGQLKYVRTARINKEIKRQRMAKVKIAYFNYTPRLVK